MTKIEVNQYGTNKAIKAHIVSDDVMREFGFKECAPNSLCPSDHWYFYRDYSDLDISFNIIISKDRKDVRIDVLDEWFCQPYDYQIILRSLPKHKIATIVKLRVEEEMCRLQEAGILSGHKYGDYI